MPGFTTHYIFGENTLEEMNSSLEKDCLLFHNKVFNLGLQGPDIFFYYFPATLFYSENIGNVIHERNMQEFFRCMLHARRLRIDPYEQDVCDAYISGFLGHYTLDCLCHPYVYYRSHYERDHGKGYFGRHVHLETDMDKEILRYYHGLRPSKFSQHDTIALSLRDKKIIAGLLYDSIHCCFPAVHISRRFILHAINAIILETKLIVDPWGWKKKLIRKVEQHFLGYATISALVPSDTLTFYQDSCNISGRKWHNPWDTSLVSQDSVFELLKVGLPVLTRRIHLCYEASYSDLIVDLGNNSYLNGLPLK